MTPEEAIRNAASNVLPVYLLLGEERVFMDRVLSTLRKVALAGGVPDFNLDTIQATETDFDRVLKAVKTAPMLSPRRLVIVRGVDHWEKTPSSKGKNKSELSPLDELAAYAADPISSACLVLVAAKLDGRKKLVVAAKSKGFLVSCDQVKKGELPRFVAEEARSRGHTIESDVANLIAEVTGPELGPVLDAIERLSLYVGAGKPITEQDVASTITRIRTSTIWVLVDAIASRNSAKALESLWDTYDPSDRGLPLVGIMAWSTRMLLRFASAVQQGASREDAAKAAGAPPFRARELAAQVRNITVSQLEGWLRVLAETDRALKGSKRPPLAILETAILTMTTQVHR